MVHEEYKVAFRSISFKTIYNSVHSFFHKTQATKSSNFN